MQSCVITVIALLSVFVIRYIFVFIIFGLLYLFVTVVFSAFVAFLVLIQPPENTTLIQLTLFLQT